MASKANSFPAARNEGGERGADSVPEELKNKFSTAVENIKKNSIFARLKNLDYYP